MDARKEILKELIDVVLFGLVYKRAPDFFKKREQKRGKELEFDIKRIVHMIFITLTRTFGTPVFNLIREDVDQQYDTTAQQLFSAVKKFMNSPADPFFKSIVGDTSVGIGDKEGKLTKGNVGKRGGYITKYILSCKPLVGSATTFDEFLSRAEKDFEACWPVCWQNFVNKTKQLPSPPSPITTEPKPQNPADPPKQPETPSPPPPSSAPPLRRPITTRPVDPSKIVRFQPFRNSFEIKSDKKLNEEKLNNAIENAAKRLG